MTETIEELAERYASAFMGEHDSATVYRERLVVLLKNIVKHDREYNG